MYEMEHSHVKEKTIDTKRNTTESKESKLPTSIKYPNEQGGELLSADDRFYYSFEESGIHQVLGYTQQYYTPLLNKTVPSNRQGIVQGVFLKLKKGRLIGTKQHKDGVIDTRKSSIEDIVFYFRSIEDSWLIRKISEEMVDKLEAMQDVKKIGQLLENLCKLGERLPDVVNAFTGECCNKFVILTERIKNNKDKPEIAMYLKYAYEMDKALSTYSYGIPKAQIDTLEKCIKEVSKLTNNAAAKEQLSKLIGWKIIGYRQLIKRFDRDPKMQMRTKDLQYLEAVFRQNLGREMIYFDLLCNMHEITFSDNGLDFLNKSFDVVKGIQSSEERALLVQLIGWKIIGFQKYCEHYPEDPMVKNLLEKLFDLETMFVNFSENDMKDFNDLLDPSNRWINTMGATISYVNNDESLDEEKKTSLAKLINWQIANQQQMLMKSNSQYKVNLQKPKLGVLSEKANHELGRFMPALVNPDDMTLSPLDIKNIIFIVNGVKNNNERMQLAQLIGRKIINDYQLFSKEEKKYSMQLGELEDDITEFKRLFGKDVINFDELFKVKKSMHSYRYTYAASEEQLVSLPARNQVIADIEQQREPIQRNSSNIESIAKDILKYLMQSESTEKLVIYRGMNAPEALQILEFFNSGQAANVEEAIMRMGSSFSIRDNDKIQFGHHLGDCAQAEGYTRIDAGYANLTLAFVLKPGAKDLLFSKSFIALQPVLIPKNMIITKGSKDEGAKAGYIGIKSEDKGVRYSLSIAANDDSKLLLQLLVDRVEVIDINIPNRKSNNGVPEKLYRETPKHVYFFNECREVRLKI